MDVASSSSKSGRVMHERSKGGRFLCMRKVGNPREAAGRGGDACCATVWKLRLSCCACSLLLFFFPSSFPA